MTKNWLILALGTVLCLVTGCSHATLQDAIQSQWDAPISIKLIDSQHNSVIFNDSGQYVFNTFTQQKGKYVYSTDGEEGWTSQSPFLLRPIVTKRNEDVVWGVIFSPQTVGRVDVEFKKRYSEQKFSVHTFVQNNTFVGYPTINIYNSDSDVMNDWSIHMTAYDKQGKILVNENYD
jgi:hypothetical protein